jgi:hypothetical protein
VLSALRGLLHVAGYFLCRRALLLHGRRDGRGDFRQALDRAADLPDCTDRFLRRGLDARNLLADLAGGFRRLLGERLHFGGNHGKAAAGVAGTRSLDGGV